jgi:molybdenum cofactor guanylyltransferase
MIAAVILAGGRASRLGGGDKGLLPLAGRPMLAQVIERLRPQVGRLAINANGDPGRFAAFGLPVIADGVPGQAGPMAGLLAGLDWAAGLGAEALVTVAADTPFFPADLVVRLRAAGRPGQPVVAATPAADGPERHPTFGLWPVALAGPLRAALAGGERRIGAWAEAEGAALALFSPAGEPFFNVNTPGDLARAREIAAGRKDGA